MRQSRKLDHLKYSLELQDGPAHNGFNDLTLVHNCLPDLAWADVKLATRLAGIPLVHPVIINAITGGAVDVTQTNAELAELAFLTDSAMAVGSQYAALENPTLKESYAIVRKKNPKGIIIANLGGHTSVVQARQAVEMIEANAIQIHLNVAQELMMTEGDRDFSRYLFNIAEIASKLEVPVIVKEVGSGIAAEQARDLVNAGVSGIDVGGMGGTNFLAIEAARNQFVLNQEVLSWGISTAISAVEVAEILPEHVDLVVSGGVRTPLDVVKSLAIGGVAVGIAAPFIKRIRNEGLRRAVSHLNEFLEDIKRYMILVGAKNIKEAQNIPMVITGYSKEWLTSRCVDITQYAVRKRHG